MVNLCGYSETFMWLIFEVKYTKHLIIHLEEDKCL